MKNKVIYTLTLAFTLSIASMGLNNIHAIPSDRWCDTVNCTDGAAHTCILCLPEDQEGED